MAFVYHLDQNNSKHHQWVIDEQNGAEFYSIGGMPGIRRYKLEWQGHIMEIHVERTSKVCAEDKNKPYKPPESYRRTDDLHKVLYIQIPDALRPEIGMLMRLIGEAIEAYEWGQMHSKLFTKSVTVEFAKNYWDLLKQQEKRR